MTENKIKSKAICILGMHRSGTSTIARAVNLLGAYLGDEKDIMLACSDNPEGFWERNDIVELHDRILNHFKISWDTALPLPDNWHLSEEMIPFRNEIVELVKKNFRNKTIWAWKDPRTSILFDIWKDVLNELGIELKCLFVIRNPLDSAKSLKKRDGFPYDKSFGIWLNYNIMALQATNDLPRAFISYDRFLGNWELELRRCAESLGLDFPKNDMPLKKEMQSFIRPDLCHSFSGLKDLRGIVAPPPVIELYELLEEFINLSEMSDESFNKRIAKLFGVFSSYGRLFQSDMERLWEAKPQLAEKTQQLAEKEHQLTEKMQQLKALRNTLSWKITKPLRKCAEFLGL